MWTIKTHSPLLSLNSGVFLFWTCYYMDLTLEHGCYRGGVCTTHTYTHHTHTHPTCTPTPHTHTYHAHTPRAHATRAHTHHTHTHKTHTHTQHAHTHHTHTHHTHTHHTHTHHTHTHHSHTPLTHTTHTHHTHTPHTHTVHTPHAHTPHAHTRVCALTQRYPCACAYIHSHAGRTRVKTCTPRLFHYSMHFIITRKYWDGFCSSLQRMSINIYCLSTDFIPSVWLNLKLYFRIFSTFLDRFGVAFLFHYCMNISITWTPWDGFCLHFQIVIITFTKLNTYSNLKYCVGCSRLFFLRHYSLGFFALLH